MAGRWWRGANPAPTIRCASSCAGERDEPPRGLASTADDRLPARSDGHCAGQGPGGRPLAITHTVRNVGPAPARAFAMRFYLSSDDALDAGDVLLGTRMIASPGAGASR
jgi:hypothetical protein